MSKDYSAAEYMINEYNWETSEENNVNVQNPLFNIFLSQGLSHTKM